MSEILSEKEINELLKTISTTANDTDTFKPVCDTRKIQIYNFVSPPTFSIMEKNITTRALSEIGQRLARKWSADYKLSLFCSVAEPYECSRHTFLTDFIHGLENENNAHFLISENKGPNKALLISDSDNDLIVTESRASQLSRFFDISTDFFKELSQKIIRDDNNQNFCCQNEASTETDLTITTSLYQTFLNTHSFSFYPCSTLNQTVTCNYANPGARYEGKKDMCLEVTMQFEVDENKETDKQLKRLTVLLSYELVQLICKKKDEHKAVSETEKTYQLPSFANKVMLDVTVSFGQVVKPLKELQKVGEGTIIELARKLKDPVIVYAGGEPIAKGETLVLDESFAARITELLK